MIREKDLTPNGSMLSYFCNKTKRCVYGYAVAVTVVVFYSNTMNGQLSLNFETGNFVPAFKRLADNDSVAQRDSLAVILT